MEAWLLKWFRRKAAKGKKERLYIYGAKTSGKGNYVNDFGRAFDSFRGGGNLLGLQERRGGIAAVWSRRISCYPFFFGGAGIGHPFQSGKDNYYLFPHLGIGLNALCLVMISFILYAGI